MVDNKNTKLFSMESIFFFTAEMLATLSSDVLHNKTDQRDNECLKNVGNGQLAIRYGQRFEPFNFPQHFSRNWFT